MDAKDKITQLLRERGWSIYELAKRSGLSSTTIANMYKRNTQPTIPSLEAMCGAFGITMSQFFWRAARRMPCPRSSGSFCIAGRRFPKSKRSLCWR